MKSKFKNSLFWGGLLFFLGIIGIFGNVLGITWRCGFICFNLDRSLMLMSFWGMLCSFIAYKKNRNPNSALIVGLILGPFGVLYWLLAKRGMSDKEQEIHDWEIEKKYQQMQKEKSNTDTR